MGNTAIKQSNNRKGIKNKKMIIATTPTNTSSSSVMGNNGLLIKIIKYILTQNPTAGHCRITNDHGIETIIPRRKVQNDIMVLAQVSKRFHKIIFHHEENGRKIWDIIPVLLVSAQRKNNFWNYSKRHSSQRRLFNKLRGPLLNADINENFLHYRHMVVKSIYIISRDMNGSDFRRLEEGMQLTGIVSLRIHPSLVSLIDITKKNDNHINNDHIYRFIYGLLYVIPNVREIDLSDCNSIQISWVFYNVLLDNLETIRWNNIGPISRLHLDGHQLSRLGNLRHILMDDMEFYCPDARQGFEEYEEGEDPANNNDNVNVSNTNRIFLFHECCTNLVRVSIRNAQYYRVQPRYGDSDPTALISQRALIKFVRNVPPTLQWFRSNLSQKNIKMLQTERPTIAFLN